MLVIRKSGLTGRLHARDLPITLAELQHWQEGMAIQRAMPELTGAQREFLLTGITEQEWEKQFGNIHQKEDTMQTRMRTFKVGLTQQGIVTDILSQAITGEFIAMANFASLSDTTASLARRMEAVEYAWNARSRAEGFINLAVQFGLQPEDNMEGQYWKGLRTCFLRYAGKGDYVGCLTIQLVMIGPFMVSIYDDVGVELDNKMGEYFCLLAEEGREMINASIQMLSGERKKNPDAFSQKLEQLHWDAMTILARWTAKADLGGPCGVCAGTCMKEALHEINLTMTGLRDNALKLYAKTLERLGLPEERTRPWIAGLPG